MVHGKLWTTEEKDWLKNNYATADWETIQTHLNRSKKTIISQAVKLKVSKRFFWGKEEREYLISLLGEYPFKRLIDNYNRWAGKNGYKTRSAYSINRIIHKYKKSKRLNASLHWYTAEEMQLLLGCSKVTANNLIKTHRNELNANCQGKPFVFSRHNFKQWIKNHPEILDRHKANLDIHFLFDLI